MKGNMQWAHTWQNKKQTLTFSFYSKTWIVLFLHLKTLFLWWKCVFQMLESSAIVWGQYWTILGNTRKYYNSGQPCPKCLCTGEQGKAYLKLLTRSVWLHSPFTKVPFLFASWGSNVSMELYGKIQTIPSIECSFGKFSNKLRGGALSEMDSNVWEESSYY